MRAFFLFYRFFISPIFQLVFGIQCRYEESCSRFTERMIKKNGLLLGVRLGFVRFLKCNSFGVKHGR